MVNLASSQRPTRVAIIGSGPAGATLAALLARKGASVAMFDDGARPPLIVGESLVPLMVPIFQRLGIEEEVAKIGVVKPGVNFTFDEKQDIQLFFTATHGLLPPYAYNVPRKEFDALILKTAIDSGVRYIQSAAKLEAVNAGAKQKSRVKLAPESLALVPGWDSGPDLVIDASGRRRLFAKLLGIGAKVGKRKDISHFAHYEDAPWPEPRGHVVTSRLQYGWAWRIPLPGRLSIGVVINKDDAKRFGSTPEEQLEGIIANDPRIARDCPNRRRVTDIATFANYQLISDYGSGENWTMVGDAFGFVDPMLSPGLCMAMVSAEKLSELIPAHGGATAGLPKQFDGYWRWLRDMLAAWQNLIDYFYDGRIFAIQRTGLDLSSRYPGKISDVMQLHMEKNLSGMATGAYINRPYSKWLLGLLGKYGIRGHRPSDFAIR